jgi:acyl-homoserine lactone acylase PvdQ
VTSEAADRTPFRDWPVWARRATYGVVLLVLAMVLALLAGVVVARHPLPQVSGRLHLEGLTGKVDVVRDAQGVPQVYADNSSDLFYAQGYVQAQDRFFQMDFRRHVNLTGASGHVASRHYVDQTKLWLAGRTLPWAFDRAAVQRTAKDTLVLEP